MLPKPTTPVSRTEFILLIAFMVSIVAMATDIMLPALGAIGRDLGVPDPNDAQMIVTSLFLGHAVGLLVAGPLSDSFGRKPVVYVGYAIFLVGCVLSTMAASWEVMILGRVLQGAGAAFPRVVTIAIIRDGYSGRQMASIVSIIMAVFIMVPMIAPAIGQLVIYLSGWRATFVFLMAIGVISALWFAARQPETLAFEARTPFSPRPLWDGFLVVCRSRVAVGYTIATGLVNGAFFGYLSTSHQVFVDAYETGALFPLYFAISALALGVASMWNAQLVLRLGMRILSWWATLGILALSLAFLFPAAMMDGLPPLWSFLAWLIAVFFCVGWLFGNLNALAMEPLGKIAGLGAAIVGCVSTLIALPLAYVIGNAYTGGVLHLIYGFAAVGVLMVAVSVWTERGIPKPSE